MKHTLKCALGFREWPKNFIVVKFICAQCCGVRVNKGASGALGGWWGLRPAAATNPLLTDWFLFLQECVKCRQKHSHTHTHTHTNPVCVNLQGNRSAETQTSSCSEGTMSQRLGQREASLLHSYRWDFKITLFSRFSHTHTAMPMISVLTPEL